MTDAKELSPAERDALLLAWDEAKKNLEVAKEREIIARKAAFSACFEAPREGVNTLELGNGYSAKGTYKVNYLLDKDVTKVEKVLDKIAAMGAEGAVIADRLVKWSADLSLTEYRQLDAKYKKVFDTIVTTREGAPTLEIKAPKEAK
jgi:hypothetical protein